MMRQPRPVDHTHSDPTKPSAEPELTVVRRPRPRSGAFHRVTMQTIQKAGDNPVYFDDSRRCKNRVRLSVESLTDYDAAFYTELALRAGESVLAPLGWNREQKQRYWTGHETHTLASLQ